MNRFVISEKYFIRSKNASRSQLSDGRVQIANVLHRPS